VTELAVEAPDVTRGPILHRTSLLTGGLWLLVLLLVDATGNYFDATSFKNLWQLVPYENLTADPFGSVWNLHVQPPLWNLTIGIVGRWSPLPEALSFALLMAGFGFIAAVLLCDTLQRVGVAARWAALLTLFVMCAPDVLVNAFEPRYELAVTAGLVAIAWILVRGAESAARSRWLVALSITATAVTMTRTMYHPIWLALLIGAFAWRWRGAVQRRSLIVSLAIPLVVVGGWMLKNEYIVGRFTLSTWTGMNLQRASIPVLSPADKQTMLAKGELSPVAAVGAFASYDYYLPAVGPCVNKWDSPVLSRLTRDGPFAIPNFNAGCFLPVFDLARHDAEAAIRAHPEAYFKGRVWSSRRWFTLEESLASSKSKPARVLHRAYRFAEVGLPGTLSMDGWSSPLLGPTSPIYHFSVLALLCSIAVLVVAVRRRRGSPFSDLHVYIGFLTVWTFASGVLFELGEQPRFRSMIDPLVFAFGIVALLQGVRALRARSSGRQAAL